MTYKLVDLVPNSLWVYNNKMVQISCVERLDVCFYYEDGEYEEIDVVLFVRNAVPYVGKGEKSPLLGIKKTAKKVGDLLNDDMVVVILTEGVYKGGYTTTVKYELADFMDDEPPFIEVCFITKQGDTVFFTEDLSKPVYELDGLLVVKAKGV